MTLGSLFDGSGGFPLAGIYAGMTPIFASEVEPYPIAVTRSRLPRMKHLGSVTEINGAGVEPVDVITFGSPCQDLSIAGKRAGIHEGERSNLFFEAIRIIKEMREATHGEYPKYAVWENVPGAFSSNKGEDFRSVLEEFVSVAGSEAVSIPLPEERGRHTVPTSSEDTTVPQERTRHAEQRDGRHGKWGSAGEIVGDGFSVAWRVLDAQYWGVPQRRKRIYLVADFGGERAGKILFERDGLSGNPQPCETERQGTADDASRSVGGSDRVECLNPWETQSIRQYAVNGVWPALSANNGGGQNRSGVCYALDSMSSNSMKSSNPHSGFHEGSVAKTLQAGGVDPTCNQGGNVIVEAVEPIIFKERAGCPGGGKGILINKDNGVFTLSTLNDQAICVAAFMGGQGSKAGGIGYSEEAAPTIKSVMSGGNTVPDVVYALQGNGIDRADTAGCNGKGWRENECYTLNTIDRPAVVYDARGNGDGETVPTLTGDHQNRVTDYTSVCVMAHGQSNAEILQNMSPTLNCNHEQPIVAMEGSYKGKGHIAENISPALKAAQPSDVAYGVDCRNAVLDEEKTHTLQAKANGGQSLNCTPSVLTAGKPPRRYIVRRLTPLECCRLQGFPDGWGDLPAVETFTDNEVEFWEGVRRTHAQIMGKKYAPAKNAAALVNWYNKLHTDSAEYKMWGNGIALPCARFVLEGIAMALKGEITA